MSRPTPLPKAAPAKSWSSTAVQPAPETLPTSGTLSAFTAVVDGSTRKDLMVEGYVTHPIFALRGASFSHSQLSSISKGRPISSKDAVR